MAKKVFLVNNSCWNFYNFRRDFIKALINNNYDVIILAPFDNTTKYLQNLGCSCFTLYFDRNISVFKDLFNFLKLLYFSIKFRPIGLCAFTIKPNIYSSIIHFITYLPVINNITGLGTIFLSKRFLYKIFSILYILISKYTTIVFYQNSHDHKYFTNFLFRNKTYSKIIPGSGVDTRYFYYANYPKKRPFIFLLVARLLKEKGIIEFLQAAKTVKENIQNCKFVLVGAFDKYNPSSISIDIVNQYDKLGIISYIGEVSDIRPHIRDCHCAVLPSYREGSSRFLLEASSMGRPIITSDVPGCNNIVIHEHNGLLIPPKSSITLSSNMIKIYNYSFNQLEQLGLNGRQHVHRNFHINSVNSIYLNYLNKMC